MPKPTPNSTRFTAMLAARKRARSRLAARRRDDIARTNTAAKTELGLNAEENITLVAKRSWIAHWPLLTVAAAAMITADMASARSAAISYVGILVFCTAVATAIALKHAVNIYLTNFRLLIHHTAFFRPQRWHAIYFREIRAVTTNKTVLGHRVIIALSSTTVALKGLSRATAQSVVDHIKDQLRD